MCAECLLYCSWSTKYTCHVTGHFETHVNPPCQSQRRSTNVQFLAAKLSTNRLSLTSYYLNILTSFYLFAGIQSYMLSVSNNCLLSFISKLYIISNIIYKSSLSTSYYLQAINYLQGLLHHYNDPYQQGPVTPSPHYKYQVPSYSLYTYSFILS